MKENILTVIPKDTFLYHTFEYNGSRKKKGSHMFTMQLLAGMYITSKKCRNMIPTFGIHQGLIHVGDHLQTSLLLLLC